LSSLGTIPIVLNVIFKQLIVIAHLSKSLLGSYHKFNQLFFIFGGMDMSKPAEVGSVKVGRYILLEGEPCKVVEFEKSKPGMQYD
jgi:hypothetical protein